MKRIFTLSLLALGFSLTLPAQLSLQVGDPTAVRPASVSNSPSIFPNHFPLPDHVVENPLGYSYLCRLELEIEERLPVGVWMKIGESSSPAQFEGLPRQNAYVRFKLFRF